MADTPDTYERCRCGHAVEHHDALCLPPFTILHRECHHGVDRCSGAHCSFVGCRCIAFVQRTPDTAQRLAEIRSWRARQDAIDPTFATWTGFLLDVIDEMLARIAELTAERDAPVIDSAHLAHQREWSALTFGPGPRTLGVLDHIRKELDEIEADPSDLGEWVDVIILAFDGAWRAGWEPQQIIDAVKAKQARNEARTWPDWRGMSEDVAIEHDRSSDG